MIMLMIMMARTVKPDPVSGLEVMESSITTNSATLTWTSPNDDETILFRVSVKNSAENSNVRVSSASLIHDCSV